MSWDIIKKHKEERGRLFKQAEEIKVKADADNKRSLSAEEAQEFDRLMGEVENLNGEIARYERAAKVGETINTRQLVGKDEIGSIGMSKKELGRYSLLRAIRSKMNNQPLDGIEAEVSAEIAKRTGKEPQGFYFPLEVALRTDPILDTTSGVGGLQSAVAGTFIELLRNKMLVQTLGASVLPNMVGTFGIPRQTAGATAYWLGENASPTASGPTLDQVTFAPTTVGAFTDITRRFINQTSIDAEQFVRNDLATVLAQAIDLAAFSGTGSDNQPKGILNDTNVPTVAIGTTGGAPTYAKFVEMETTVANNNADMGRLAYVTNPKVRGTLKGVKRDNYVSQFVWADDNSINGYPAYVSAQIPSNLTKSTGENLSAAIFGNWSDLVLAMWGGLDILVDPYTGSKTGTVRVVALQDVDIKLRHATSFAKIVDIVTA